MSNLSRVLNKVLGAEVSNVQIGEKSFESPLVDVAAVGNADARIRPITLSVSGKKEYNDGQEVSNYKVSLVWNDSWTTLFENEFQSADEATKAYNDIEAMLRSTNESITAKDFQNAEKVSQDLIDYLQRYKTAKLVKKYQLLATNELGVIAKETKDSKQTPKLLVDNNLFKKMGTEIGKEKLNALSTNSPCSYKTFLSKRNTALSTDIGLLYWEFLSGIKTSALGVLEVVSNNTKAWYEGVSKQAYLDLTKKLNVQASEFGYTYSGYGKCWELVKQGEVTLQNIFFDDVSELNEYLSEQKKDVQKDKEIKKDKAGKPEIKPTDMSEVKPKDSEEEAGVPGMGESPAAPTSELPSEAPSGLPAATSLKVARAELIKQAGPALEALRREFIAAEKNVKKQMIEDGDSPSDYAYIDDRVAELSKATNVEQLFDVVEWDDAYYLDLLKKTVNKASLSTQAASVESIEKNLARAKESRKHAIEMLSEKDLSDEQKDKYAKTKNKWEKEIDRLDRELSKAMKAERQAEKDEATKAKEEKEAEATKQADWITDVEILEDIDNEIWEELGANSGGDIAKQWDAYKALVAKRITRKVNNEQILELEDDNHHSLIKALVELGRAENPVYPKVEGKKEATVEKVSLKFKLGDIVELTDKEYGEGVQYKIIEVNPEDKESPYTIKALDPKLKGQPDYQLGADDLGIVKVSEKKAFKKRADYLTDTINVGKDLKGKLSAEDYKKLDDLVKKQDQMLMETAIYENPAIERWLDFYTIESLEDFIASQKALFSLVGKSKNPEVKKLESLVNDIYFILNNIKKEEKLDKQSKVVHMEGHKDSKGELAEWVIKSHESGEIVSSHKTKEDAESHLKDINIHKNMTLYKGASFITQRGSFYIFGDPKLSKYYVLESIEDGAEAVYEAGSMEKVEEWIASYSKSNVVIDEEAKLDKNSRGPQITVAMDIATDTFIVKEKGMEDVVMTEVKFIDYLVDELQYTLDEADRIVERAWSGKEVTLAKLDKQSNFTIEIEPASASSAQLEELKDLLGIQVTATPQVITVVTDSKEKLDYLTEYFRSKDVKWQVKEMVPEQAAEKPKSDMPLEQLVIDEGKGMEVYQKLNKEANEETLKKIDELQSQIKILMATGNDEDYKKARELHAEVDKLMKEVYEIKTLKSESLNKQANSNYDLIFKHVGVGELVTILGSRWEQLFDKSIDSLKEGNKVTYKACTFEVESIIKPGKGEKESGDSPLVVPIEVKLRKIEHKDNYKEPKNYLGSKMTKGDFKASNRIQIENRKGTLTNVSCNSSGEVELVSVMFDSGRHVTIKPEDEIWKKIEKGDGVQYKGFVNIKSKLEEIKKEASLEKRADVIRELANEIIEDFKEAGDPDEISYSYILNFVVDVASHDIANELAQELARKGKVIEWNASLKKQANPGTGISPAIYKTVVQAVKDGKSYDEAKELVKKANPEWELAKEDYEEAKKEASLKIFAVEKGDPVQTRDKKRKGVVTAVPENKGPEEKGYMVDVIWEDNNEKELVPVEMIELLYSTESKKKEESLKKASVSSILDWANLKYPSKEGKLTYDINKISKVAEAAGLSREEVDEVVEELENLQAVSK